MTQRCYLDLRHNMAFLHIKPPSETLFHLCQMQDIKAINIEIINKDPKRHPSEWGKDIGDKTLEGC